MPIVLITGGTGLVGTALTQMLVDKGYQVIILTRNAQNKKSDSPAVSYAEWDIHSQTIDKSAISKADHIIHLAGAGVADERWTEKRKAEIRDSRTKSSHLLVKALKENSNKVQTILSASAIGWYGQDANLPKGYQAYTENLPSDDSFLGETCRLWEESITPVTAFGKRLVIVRTGIVLSNQGGAFTSFKLPIKFGIAAVLGDGKQVISWIHIDDLCRIYIDAIENPKLSGIYNAVAPSPVSNKMFTLELAKKLKGKFFISVHVPAFILKLVLGQMSIEVLKSATISSQKISETGFTFLYPHLNNSLNELCGQNT